jgi:regulatory protein
MEPFLFGSLQAHYRVFSPRRAQRSTEPKSTAPVFRVRWNAAASESPLTTACNPLHAMPSLLLLSSGILLIVAFKRGRPIEDEAALYNYAVGALGRRMRSVAELKRLLRGRVPEGELGTVLVEMVILRLKEQKYLNDSSYAAAYTSFRKENEKFGPRRVITDLKVKGVHGDVIEKAVGEAYSAVDEQELARAFLRRKRLKEPQNQKDAARIFRSLTRAGFGANVIFKILKNWNVDEETLSVLQQHEPEDEASESRDE